LAKAENSQDEYWGPLSLTTVSGIPYLENMDFSPSIMFLDVVVPNLMTSMYLEK